MEAVTRAATRKSGYIPSLDGWRAVAILGVLLTHDLPIYAGHTSLRVYQGFGGWGVHLFFAISGILICGRVLDDEKLTGRFKIGAFYVRRLFRIQPALLCYLLVMGLLMLLQVCPGGLRAWLGALFLYTNFQFNDFKPLPGSPLLGHFWTLALEEQFYLLLSLLLFLFRKNRVIVFALALAALLTFQSIARSRGFFVAHISDRRTYWQLQYLLFPAWCAVLFRTQQIGPLVRKYLRPWVAFAITADWLLINVGPHRPGPGLVNALNANINYLLYLLPLCLMATMYHPESMTTRFLELKPMRYVGRLSYSIYLWHLLFFEPAYAASGIHSPVLVWLSGRPWKYLAVLGAAMLSYYLVERPMIRLGHRLAPPATPGHRDLAASGSFATGARHEERSAIMS